MIKMEYIKDCEYPLDFKWIAENVIDIEYLDQRTDGGNNFKYVNETTKYILNTCSVIYVENYHSAGNDSYWYVIKNDSKGETKNV